MSQIMPQVPVMDMEASAVCRPCGRVQVVALRRADYMRWRAGVKIQDALPYLSEGEREAMMTGTCGECWERMFGGWDDEEEGEER